MDKRAERERLRGRLCEARAKMEAAEAELRSLDKARARLRNAQSFGYRKSYRLHADNSDQKKLDDRLIELSGQKLVVKSRLQEIQAEVARIVADAARLNLKEEDLQ